jgi:hypothetical protein
MPDLMVTPLGKESLKKKDTERKAIGSQVAQGKNVGLYVTGPCFHAAIFVRYMLGTKIKSAALKNVDVNSWAKVLGVTTSSPAWDGAKPIPAGAAVAFFRTNDKKWFHVGIGAGGHKIRAVNGGPLGLGWHEVDIAKVLGKPDESGTFDYDRAKIKVYLAPN